MDEYDVYMLSGITASKLTKSENDLNNRLWESEHSGRKSITVTCDKYTTGSTINLWDTMLYFKDGDSAEYYDQTWGRILSRAVVDVLDENNNPVYVPVLGYSSILISYDELGNRIGETYYDTDGSPVVSSQ